MVGVGLYVRNSAEAVKTYIAAFGMELGYHVLRDDGSFFHSELMKNGEEQLSVVEGDGDVKGNPVHLGIDFTSRDELEKAFNILKEGGTVLMDICELAWSPCAAEVIDRFGVIWYLSLPQHRPADDFVPDK